MSKLYTVRQIAALVGCSSEHVRRMMKEGIFEFRVLPSFGTGRRKRRLVTHDELVRVGLLEPVNNFQARKIRELMNRLQEQSTPPNYEQLSSCNSNEPSSR